MGPKARAGAKAMSLAFVLLDFQHVIGAENIRFQARSCISQPGNFTGWGSEGVKHHVCLLISSDNKPGDVSFHGPRGKLALATPNASKRWRERFRNKCSCSVECPQIIYA